MKINTVLGALDTKDMGVTLMHEHIINVDWAMARAFPGFYDRKETVERFCRDMDSLKPFGVKTFIDATPINLGRDLTLMQECSEKAQVNIIAVTGIYYQEDPFYQFGCDPEVLAEYMITDIEKGMEGTSAKAGIIKCASQKSPGKTEANRGMIKAAAIAHKATGLPIYTHNDPYSDLGRWQNEILMAEGIDPKKICYGHVFTCGDRKYLDELSKTGAYLGCDQLSIWFPGTTDFGPADEVLKNAVDYVKDPGKRRKMFLSCDAAVRSDFGYTICKNRDDVNNNFLNTPYIRKATMFDSFIPSLKKAGVTDDELKEVLEINPRRFFGEEL